MSINKQRYRRYLRQMKELEERVGQVRFIEIFQQKLIDLLSSGAISKKDLNDIDTVVQRLFGDVFVGFHKQVINSYDDILELLNTEYNDLSGELNRQVAQLQDIETVSNLQLGDYKDSTADAISHILKQGLKEGWNIDEMIEHLSPINDRAARYARTLAQTQIKRYGRAGKYRKAELAGIQYFEYAGIYHDTIRAFCRACLHKIFFINDIFHMKNGNLEPVYLNCGGWNCIHDWEPDATANAKDAVQGHLISIKQGTSNIQLYGGQAMKKTYKFSQYAESIFNRYSPKEYVQKCIDKKLTDQEITHIARHYKFLKEETHKEEIRRRVDELRHNYEHLYYEYHNGPRIVFEKDREFLFVSPQKIHTMYNQMTEKDYEDKYESQIQYWIEITHLL